MSEQSEDRKPDLSKFPRGAINIRGLPVSRNARLPSIRTPRDLTLGAPPKRTFVPNIPVRREKRAPEPNEDQPSSSNIVKMESRPPAKSERGKGKGRGREIIQTEGVFGGGIAALTKARNKEPSYSKSVLSSGKISALKKDKPIVTTFDMSREMDKLLRDDFVDYGSDEDNDDAKPVIFPAQEKSKKDTLRKSVKQEKIDEDFKNENFAKELGFDVQKISKFIKKEKTDAESVKQEESVKPAENNISDLPIENITDLLKSVSDSSQLLLLQFPECVTTRVPDYQQKGQASTENGPLSEQKDAGTSLSALPEGLVGKLQILKSGRARLVIGSIHHNLDTIKPLNTMHEVVSIKTDTDSGDITVLGNMKHKLCFVPDIGRILT